MEAVTPESESFPASERSFEVLAGEYRPMLMCYLAGVLGEKHLAEDLTQETFLTAHHLLDRFEAGGNFGSWLRGIARNKVREHQRAAARRPLVIDSRIVEGMEQVYTLFDAPDTGAGSWGERLEVVRDCMAKLKSKLRSAVESVYQRGRTLREAAAELEASTAAIGQRLTRARRLIRECTELNVPTPPPSRTEADHG